MRASRRRLAALHPDARNFFGLFKHMDIDGSRRLSYGELERLVREELKLRKELPEAIAKRDADTRAPVGDTAL